MEKPDRKQGLTADVYSEAYDEHRGLVRRAILETMPSANYDNDVDDLAQDVWERVWEKRDQFKGDLSKLSTWIFNIAVSVTQNYMRDCVERAPQVLSEWELPRPEVGDDYEGSWLEQNSIDGDDPEALMMAEEEAAMNYSTLSPQEEWVFNLMYVRGLSATEAAEELGVSRNTIGPIINRLQRKMKSM